MKVFPIDETTKLLTRDFLKDGLNKELSQAKRFYKNLSLLLLEISDNQSEIKSLAVKNLARIVRNQSRRIDYSVLLDNKIVLVLPQVSRAQVQQIAKRIIQRAANPFSLDEDQFAPIEKLEFKAVTFPEDGESKEELFDKLKIEV